MKITVPREVVGRLLGMLILTTLIVAASYLCTAWVWWELNPGAWSAGARGTALGFVAFALIVRNVSIRFAEPEA
jgi:hypothetical protein